MHESAYVERWQRCVVSRMASVIILKYESGAWRQVRGDSAGWGPSGRAAAGVTPRSRCGSGWRGAPRPGLWAPGGGALRPRTRCYPCARSASKAQSACEAPQPAPRPPASRASPAPAGTRSPRGSIHHNTNASINRLGLLKLSAICDALTI